jgi:hypothetical protein
MKKYLVRILIFFIVITVSNKAYSQLDVSSEIGVMFGVTSFQTDFGISKDFPSENAQTMGYGLVHYLKFFGKQYSWRSGSTFFSEHFMLKTEFLYINNTNIKHEHNPTSEVLKNMRGNIKMFNFGNQMEFYFFNIEDYAVSYRDKRSFNPYLSLGIHYSWYDPEVTSNLPDLGDENWRNFVVNEKHDKWLTPEGAEALNGSQTIFNESGSTFGVSFGAGVRYSMEYFDLVLDSRWQHFFSDRVDGLDAYNDPANKYNDTMVYINLGIVYTFNNSY